MMGRPASIMEGALPALVAFLAATFVATHLARLMSVSKQRRPAPWMWATALFPPSAGALALVPGRRPAPVGASR
jgi:hypothetical protein